MSIQTSFKKATGFRAKRFSFVFRTAAASVVTGILTGALTSVTLLLSGCDTTEVDPFFSAERYYSIYGAFDMDFTVQHLRVIPIDTVVSAIDDSIDAEVTTTDLVTGQSWAWRDSLFSFDDGSVGHVFSAPFRVQQGRTYRTEVVRSDGATTWAETRVPVQPKAEMGARSVITSETSSFPTGTQKVFWKGAYRRAAQG